jgi:hypothetical protein
MSKEEASLKTKKNTLGWTFAATIAVLTFPQKEVKKYTLPIYSRKNDENLKEWKRIYNKSLRASYYEIDKNQAKK